MDVKAENAPLFARAIADVLAAPHAADGLVSHGEMQHRAVEAHDAAPLPDRALGGVLDMIAIVCRRTGAPDLSSVVVNLKTRKPGTARCELFGEDLAAQQAAARAADWERLPAVFAPESYAGLRAPRTAAELVRMADGAD